MIAFCSVVWDNITRWHYSWGISLFWKRRKINAATCDKTLGEFLFNAFSISLQLLIAATMSIIFSLMFAAVIGSLSMERRVVSEHACSALCHLWFACNAVDFLFGLLAMLCTNNLLVHSYHQHVGHSTVWCLNNTLPFHSSTYASNLVLQLLLSLIPI